MTERLPCIENEHCLQDHMHAPPAGLNAQIRPFAFAGLVTFPRKP